jgi:hypothetical protein
MYILNFFSRLYFFEESSLNNITFEVITEKSLKLQYQNVLMMLIVLIQSVPKRT